MRTFQSKPQTVCAIQWTGDNWEELHASPAPVKSPVHRGSLTRELFLMAGKDGAQGWVFVPVGHWVVWSPEDLTDFWPVEDAYFRNKYEEVS